MFIIIFGAFIVLHGLVHLLYLGQSRRIFELQPGMAWPDGSWAFSRILGDETARLLASLFLALAALGFVAGGAGLLTGQPWWRPLVVGAAAFSAVIYLLFWDGGWQDVDDKGAIGLLLDVAILAAVLVLSWPGAGA
jgi:hypothetical protein